MMYLISLAIDPDLKAFDDMFPGADMPAKLAVSQSAQDYLDRVRGMIRTRAIMMLADELAPLTQPPPPVPNPGKVPSGQ